MVKRMAAAEDHVESEGAHPVEREAVLEDPQHQRADEGADDSVPEPPVRSVPPITAEAMAMNMISDPPASGSIEPMRNASMTPAKPAEHAAQHEIADLDAAHFNADFRRGDEIAAGGDGVKPEPSAVEHELQHDRDRQRPGEPRPWRAPESRREDCARLRLDGKPAGDRQGQAIDEKHRAERGDESRHAEKGGDRPVDESDHSGRRQSEDHRRARRDPVRNQEMHDEGDERIDHPHGQIEFAADQHHDFARGNDRGRRSEVDKVLDVGDGEKSRIGRLEINREQDAGEQDARLTPAQHDIARPAQPTRLRRIKAMRVGVAAVPLRYVLHRRSPSSGGDRAGPRDDLFG